MRKGCKDQVAHVHFFQSRDYCEKNQVEIQASAQDRKLFSATMLCCNLRLESKKDFHKQQKTKIKDSDMNLYLYQSGF